MTDLRGHGNERVLAFRFKPEQWLWCLHCERFFQGRDARRDCVGGIQGCAFLECDGAGYGVDIYDWDAWPQDDPQVLVRWPAQSELHKGLRAAAWSNGGDADGYDPWGDLEPEPGFVRNLDLQRRDSILGIAADGGTRHTQQETTFGGLDLLGLATLLQDRYLAPWDRHRLGPPVAACLDLVARFPEIRFAGRLVPVSDSASGIALTSLECDLEELSSERREAVCLGVACFCVEDGEWDRTDTQLFGSWDQNGPT